MRARPSLSPLIFVVALFGCHDPAGGPSGSADPPSDRGCKPLDATPKTMVDIDAQMERWKNSRYESGMKLKKGSCGEYELATASDGYASFDWYLKDGVVVGESYGDDAQGGWCKGTIPSCK